MTFHWLKTTLNLCLMIAFMSMQLSSAHIHVAEHHQHDGSKHAHVAKAHAHSLSDHHQDAFDDTPVASSLVVEIAQESIQQTCQSSDQPSLQAFDQYCPFIPLRSVTKNSFSNTINPLASWLHYSTVRSRAPPISLV